MDKPLFITSNKEYEEKLKEVERLVALDPGTENIDGIRLKFLSCQVEMYEKLHFDFGAKLANARKIRDEILRLLYNIEPKDKANHIRVLRGQLTKIIKKHL